MVACEAFPNVTVPGPLSFVQVVAVAPLALPDKVATIPAVGAGSAPVSTAGASDGLYWTVRSGRWVRVAKSSEQMRANWLLPPASVVGE